MKRSGDISDVFVVGGGPSGRAAAIAARGGVSVVLVMLLAASLAHPAWPQRSAPATGPPPTLTVDPGQSTLHWEVGSTLHMVHGTFTITRGSIQFNPETGNASGEIVVSTTSGQSGDSSRDARMHAEILETAKYPEAIFRPSQVEGKVAASGASEVKIHGIFSIHGVDHDLTATVHLEMEPHHWKADCKFEVPYIAWGIKDPSNFLLKVKPVVNVELQTTGSL